MDKFYKKLCNQWSEWVQVCLGKSKAFSRFLIGTNKNWTFSAAFRIFNEFLVNQSHNKVTLPLDFRFWFRFIQKINFSLQATKPFTMHNIFIVRNRLFEHSTESILNGVIFTIHTHYLLLFVRWKKHFLTYKWHGSEYQLTKQSGNVVCSSLPLKIFKIIWIFVFICAQWE